MHRVTVPAPVRRAVLVRQRGRCALCAAPLTLCELDHVVPYALRPRHGALWLQALCLHDHRLKTLAEAGDLALAHALATRTPSARLCWLCRRVVSAYWYCGWACAACARTPAAAHAAMWRRLAAMFMDAHGGGVAPAAVHLQRQLVAAAVAPPWPAAVARASGS